jgi:hypothetical protein
MSRDMSISISGHQGMASSYIQTSSSSFIFWRLNTACLRPGQKKEFYITSVKGCMQSLLAVREGNYCPQTLSKGIISGQS